MKNQSLYDQIIGGIGNAIADIREKVVEEPWFGRTVTERESSLTIEWPEAREAQPIECAEPERDHKQEQEQELDR